MKTFVVGVLSFFVVVIGGSFAYWFFAGDVSNLAAGIVSGKEPTVDWKLLYKLDYKTGKGPSELTQFHNKRVRIPGFIVPLSDDVNVLDEFLLVPDAMSCIHVPPPPPNLIVHVKLDDGIPMEKVNNPSWVSGVFRIEKANSIYGSSAYQMKADSLEKFEF